MYLIKILKGLKKEESGNNRIFDSIKIKNTSYLVSVQASYAHYCSPRKTTNVEEYEKFEVFLDIPFEDIPGKWLKEYSDGSGEIFAFVPKKEIEDLLMKLKTKYENKA